MIFSFGKHFFAAISFAAFVCGASAQSVSPQVYYDPLQRFSIQLASGWTAKADPEGNGGVTISREAGAYLLVLVEKGADADGLLEHMSSKSQKQFPGYGISQKSSETLAGQPAKKIFAVGKQPNGTGAAVINIETFATGGYTYCAFYYASGDSLADSRIYNDTDTEESMLKTLRLGATTTQTAAPAAGGPANEATTTNEAAKTPAAAGTSEMESTYSDPQQRFNIAVPAGWFAKSFDAGGASGVTLVHGANAYLQILLEKGLDPPTFLKSLNDNMEKLLPGYQITDRGKRTLCAHPSSFILGRSQAATGTEHTFVYLETFAANGYTYSVVASSKGESLTDQRMLADFNLSQDMIKTLALGGAAKQAKVAPPAAGAPVASNVPGGSAAGGQSPATSTGPTVAPTPSAKGWNTFEDPSGFSVNVPEGWGVYRDRPTGRISVVGSGGERAVIWPMFLEKQQLDGRGAAALLQQLAQKLDAKMPWAAAAGTANVVRVTGKGPQRSGAAMLSWANEASGTQVYMYVVEAPAELYKKSEDAFVGILKSFHVVQDASQQNAGGIGSAARDTALRFVNWSDPHEGAFSVDVPQGWQIIGGAYRLSTTDVRYAVAMASPDGQIRATIGDSGIGLFTQPTAMLARGGLREGGSQMLSDGTKLEIRRYISGQDFARTYVENFVSRQCSNLTIRSSNARQDLAATFSQSARNDGLTSAQLTAGATTFTCTLNGNAVQGEYVAATAVLSPNQSPMWAAYRLYGYMAPAGRQQEGERVIAQAIQTWKFNPQWEGQQKGAANAALQQDNARSQQIRSRALAAIAEDQRSINETITKGYEERQKTYDEISRKRENSILGTLDVIDPQTGVQYKVSNYGNYHYMSPEGYIISTNSANTPGPDVREMITLP